MRFKASWCHQKSSIARCWAPTGGAAAPADAQQCSDPVVVSHDADSRLFLLLHCGMVELLGVIPGRSEESKAGGGGGGTLRVVSWH